MKLNTLTPEEESVILHKGTEAPFSGMYENFSQPGVYACKRCGAYLYRSDDKFDARCGWPSFDRQILGAVGSNPDADGIRTEISCVRCGAHLGHVFTGEHFTPTNTRHCVNSISLSFMPNTKVRDLESAYFAGGCFWCLEAVYQQTKGITQVTSGYVNQIETVKLEYHPDVISFEALLTIFFTLHDPTSLDRQGNDIGHQYHSAIFSQSKLHLEIAVNFIHRLESEKIYNRPIVTEVLPLSQFRPAENHHQDYYRQHLEQPYCQLIISPKLAKLRQKLADYFTQI